MKTIILNETESHFSQMVIAARDKHSFDRMVKGMMNDETVTDKMYCDRLDAIARQYGLNASQYENVSMEMYIDAITQAASNFKISIEIN